MKIPTMTKGKHWLYLFGLIFVEAVLAFVCFMIGPPISYAGLALIVIANIQLMIAIAAYSYNSSRKIN